MNDSEILKKLKDRDEQALTHLMDRYVNYVSAILCNMTGQFLTEEDIESWRQTCSFPYGTAVSAWSRDVRLNRILHRLHATQRLDASEK